MPKPPEHAAGLTGLGLTLALLLAGCATTSDSADEAGQAMPALEQIAARLPGDYVSVQENGRRLQTLRIETESRSDSGALGLSMRQADADGANARRFGLKLEPGGMSNRLDGEFALLGAQERSRRSCPMSFHLSERSMVGETEPGSCRFGQNGETVGLLKEIAFDGRRLTIGDRLVDPESGEALGRDQVIRFLPLREFEGWLGVREGEDWRIAREFDITTGASIEPLDAAQMGLGVAVSLSYYRMERGSDEVLLRLSVSDPDSGAVLAESWSTPESRSIGVALPDLQVGLRLSR